MGKIQIVNAKVVMTEEGSISSDESKGCSWEDGVCSFGIIGDYWVVVVAGSLAIL